MSDELKAAVINARCATAMIRAMGMQAANDQDPNGAAFTKKDFDDVILEEGVHWNAVAEYIKS